MGMIYRSLFMAINVSPMHTILQMPYYDSAMRRKMFSFWSKEKQTEYSSNKLHPEFTNQIWMRDHRGRPFTYSLHILFYHPLKKNIF